MTTSHNIPFGAHLEMYHPDVVKLLAPRLRYDAPDDMILIPVCPNCGYGRTLNLHIRQETKLVIEPSFRAWCKECREKMADKLDAIDKRRKDFWG